MTLKLKFRKYIFLYEFITFVFLSFPGSMIQDIIYEVEPISFRATIKNIERFEHITITINETDDIWLILHEGWFDYADIEKLHLLQKNDTITFVQNKFDYGPSGLYYFTGQVNLIGLSSKKLGPIFEYETYLENHLNLFLITIILLFSIPSLIGMLAIIYGWILALLLYLFPKKYHHLRGHLLIHHKIERKIP